MGQEYFKNHPVMALIRFIICYCLFCFVLSQWRPFNWIELTGLQDIKVAFAYNSLVAGQEEARELSACFTLMIPDLNLRASHLITLTAIISQPIRGQYSGHVISLGQLEAAIWFTLSSIRSSGQQISIFLQDFPKFYKT